MIKIAHKPFILIRHGETYANTEKLTCGLMDSQLTKEGVRQASEIGNFLYKKFYNTNIEIFHSSLTRSKMTAKIASRKLKKIDLKEFGDLNEQSFGAWEGLKWDEVIKYLENGLVPPGGESRQVYTSRVVNAINHILSVSNGLPIIVAHGGTFFALANSLGMYPKDMGNCCIVEFIPSIDNNKTWETYIYDKHSCKKTTEDIFITTK